MSEDLFEMLNSMSDSDEDAERSKIQYAPFGYPGGKSRSIDNLMRHLPYRNSWVDVFGGSGVVTLNRRPSKIETFNDRYAGVTQFYRCLADKVLMEKLIERLEYTVMSREEFLFCKKNWEDHTVDIVERAARWFYMVQMSFGGLGRNFGRSTKGSVTIAGKLRNSLIEFEPIHQRLKKVQIENLDFKQCIKDFDDTETVFYCDPPYLDTDQSGYGGNKFSRTDHIDLLNLVFESKGFFAVSAYKNELYEKYPWNQRHEWEVAVSSLSMAFTEENHHLEAQDTRMRTKAVEVLYIKHERD